jgi:hypothetical protein
MANMSAMRRTALVAGVFFLGTGFKPSAIAAISSPEAEGKTPLPLS